MKITIETCEDQAADLATTHAVIQAVVMNPKGSMLDPTLMPDGEWTLRFLTAPAQQAYRTDYRYPPVAIIESAPFWSEAIFFVDGQVLQAETDYEAVKA